MSLVLSWSGQERAITANIKKSVLSSLKKRKYKKKRRASLDFFYEEPAMCFFLFLFLRDSTRFPFFLYFSLIISLMSQ